METSDQPLGLTATDSANSVIASQPATITQVLHPVGVSERITTLDVLRGFALLGIFMVNMQFFSMPFMQAVFDRSLATAPASEQAAWAFVKILFEYKFISLFSLLFGVGFSVQLMRARARNAPFIPVYFRRTLVLLCIGVVHALLLWFGDILTFYALFSLGLMATFWMRARGLLITASVVFIVGVLLGVGITSLQLTVSHQTQRDTNLQRADAGDLQPAQDDASQKLLRFRDLDLQGGHLDPNTPEWMEVETNALKYGPFSEALIVRAVSFAMGLVYAFFGFGWHILAMFLLGAGLMKLDFFAARFAGWHTWLALVSLPLGLIIEGIAAYVMLANDHAFGWYLVPVMAMHEVGSVATCLGYVGLWAVIVEHGWLSRLTNALACTGRMALSNYLTQTVVATFLMYWWGFGWFGDVNRIQQIGIVLLVYPLQVLLSVMWMRAVSIGPMEWLWRSLTYLRYQPVGPQR